MGLTIRVGKDCNVQCEEADLGVSEIDGRGSSGTVR